MGCVMNALNNFLNLDEQRKLCIGVCGDAMLDQYYDVRVKKISPEFPIPVMHSETDECLSYPGGAANVAYQFKNFNVDASLIAFSDIEATSCFQEKGINADLCLLIENLIPRKKRFYSEDFPTYRWDVEKSSYGLGSDLDKTCKVLFEKAKNHVKNFDALIFSDYDKGVLNKHLNALIDLVPITVIDPKCGDVYRWKNCTVFKPNASEAIALTGCKNLNDAGKKLYDELNCKAVIITQAGNGVSIFDSSGIQEIRPTKKLPTAESVIGAGDCFTAFLTMSLAHGMSVYNAATVAWNAGVLYVMNRHNKPLNKFDLQKVFDKSCSKINILPENKRDYKLVFTNGCFDILHAGHIETLKFAKSLGDKLLVAVNTDESVAENKPGRPYVKLEDRMKLLASLEFVDFVVPFSEKTPLNLIQTIKPDVLVKGSEYEKENIVGYGIVPEIVVAPMVQGLSTTNLIDKIKNH